MKTDVAKTSNEFASLKLSRHQDNADLLVLTATDKMADDTEIVLWFSQDQLRKFCEATLAELNYEPFSD